WSLPSSEDVHHAPGEDGGGEPVGRAPDAVLLRAHRVDEPACGGQVLLARARRHAPSVPSAARAAPIAPARSPSEPGTTRTPLPHGRHSTAARCSAIGSNSAAPARAMP